MYTGIRSMARDNRLKGGKDEVYENAGMLK